MTFLFTDVEGSTRLWQEQPEAMRVALERHDEILRAAIEAQDGYVFATAGDSFAATFQDHRAAFRAALSAQELLADEAWPAEAPIRVRMGVHTGDAFERDGDYFGSALSVASRIMNAGHGGQVLVSAATNGLPHDVETRSLGVHRLRDLSEPQEIFELASGERFPPLRSLDLVLHNLPVVSDALVGRDDAVNEIVSLMGDHRVVTIVGVGGIGKTRLALEVAARSSENFADGVWLCELASVGDPAALAQEVADAIGIRQWPGRSMVESLAEFSRHREMLVVVDNCEHIVDAVADVILAIVAVAPSVRVLATSREALGCAPEATYSLGPLAVGGLRSPAAELFLRRAAQIDAARVWSDDEATAIERVCDRLDGVPLALELAAARTRTLTPVEVEERLADAFRSLRGGRRRVERHRTLQAAIQWSYDSLTESERELFDSLAVFVGGAGLDAVEAVCNPGNGVGDVVELLDELVAKSLLVTERTSWGRTRFRLLEPLRQFAEDRLAQRGQSLVTHRRHMRHYTEWAEAWNADVWGTGTDLGDRLAAEFANIRAAVDFAVETNEADFAARIVTAMQVAQQGWERLEVGDWAARTLGLDEAQSDALGPHVAAQAAASCWWRGDVPGMSAWIEQTKAMPAYDPAAPGHTSVQATYTSLVLGDADAALAIADRMRLITARDRVGAAWARQTAVRGDDQSATLIARLRDDADSTGSDLVRLIADGLAAEHLVEQFDFEPATVHARRSIETARAIGATYYAHFFTLWLGLAARGADSVTTRDLELIGLSLREQRDAGHEADQWLVLVGAACALGDATIAVAVQDGLRSSQWANSGLIEALSSFMQLDTVRTATADHTKQQDAPALGPLVEQVLVTINDHLGQRNGPPDQRKTQISR